MINHHHYQRVTYLHGANTISGFIDESVGSWGEFLLLKEKNKQLLIHNEQLLNQVYNTDGLEVAEIENLGVDTLCDVNTNKAYILHSAKVVNKTVNKLHNYLTIGIGTNHGIEEEMGVISDKGLVGIVKNVSANYATVMTLIHKESRVSALLNTTKNFGSLRWNGKDTKTAQLYDIPSYVPIPMGDTLVTSGFSSIFPEGINIGTIRDKNISKGDNFYVLDVDLLTDFNSLYNVYVIDYTDKAERKALERATIKGIRE